MIVRLYEKNGEAAEVVSAAYSQGSTAINVGKLGGDSFSVQAVIDVDTPSAVIVPSADISAVNNTFTKTAHGLTTGIKGQWTTSSALPTGLSLATDYFVIKVDADVFKVAASLSDALAGTPIDISTAGTGNQTFTPTALAGGTIKLQQSNKSNPTTDSDWSDLGSATNITVDALVYLEKDRPTSLWVRSYITLTAGHITTTLNILVKGDKAG